MAITQPAVTEQRNGPSTKQNHVTNVTRVEADANGVIRLTESHGALKSVDVADVDLVLGFADGSFIIIPNGALDALEINAPKVEFDGDKYNTSLSELFKQVGTVDAADAGNLRIISENIDTRLTELQPDEIDYTSLFMALNNHSSAPAAPAAPLPQAPSLPQAAQVQRGSINGRGNNSGEAMDAIIPPRVDQPSTYRLGNRVETAENLNIGLPVINGSLYTSDNFKVAGGTAETALPRGARDAGQSEDSAFNTAARSAASQAYVEKISGTSGNDTINWNTAGFSASDETWSKTFHLSTNGLDNISTIRLQSSGNLPDGFTITGPGVTSVTTGSATTWFINPAMLNADGSIDLDIFYNVGGTNTDFTINAYIQGTSGPFTFDVGKDFYFSYRDATTTDEFTATKNGEAVLILPSNGTGYVIDGGDGDDIISAGAGNDTLIGGNGSNTLDGGAGNNTASYQNMSGNVTAQLNNDNTGTGAAIGQGGTDTYANIQNLTGGTGDDHLSGNAGANRLIGGDGNDTLIGNGGADTLDGGNGIDTASFAGLNAVNVTLDAQGNGTAKSNSGDVTLISIENLVGTSNNDIFTLSTTPELDTASGAIKGTIDGGAGVDSVIYNVNNDINVNLHNGTVNGLTGVLTNIENITTGTGNDIIVASTVANRIDGGAGNNTVDYEHAASSINVNIIDTSVESIVTGANTTADNDVLINIQNIKGSLIGNDTITVGNFNSTIDARDGHNRITATGINNTYVITSGSGNDTIEATGNGNNVINSGAGNDRITLGNGSNTVTTSAGDNYIKVGNGNNNTITTGAGNDTIIAGTGTNNFINAGNGNNNIEVGNVTSTIIGGSGTDTVFYNLSTTNVYASLQDQSAGTNAGNAVTGRLVDIDNLTGGSGNDTLIGNDGNNVLRGGAGNDVIFGGGGNDTIYGGTGADSINGGTGTNTAVYTSSVLVSLTDGLSRTTNTNGDVLGSGTIVNGGITGRATGGSTANAEAFGDILTNIQNLTVEGSGASYLIGNDQANVLTGGSGNDTLEGIGNALGLGGDTLNGGTGIDTVTYIHATSGVQASLEATGLTGDALMAANAAGITNNRGTITGTIPGTSTGYATDTFISIENLTGTRFDDVLIADFRGSTLRGGSGNDTLIGGAGNDMLDGGDGDDIIYAAQGHDTVSAGAGNDTIYVSVDIGNSNATTSNPFPNRFTSVDGGTGHDTLMLGGLTDQLFSLTTLVPGVVSTGSAKVTNIDVINIKDDGASTTFAVDANSIKSVVTSGSQLTIVRDAGDTLSFTINAGEVVKDASGNLVGSTTTIDGTYYIYADSTATSALASVVWTSVAA